MTKKTENGNNDTSLSANCEILHKIQSSWRNTVCFESLLLKSKPNWRLNLGKTAEMLDCVERNFSRLSGTNNGDQSKNKKQSRLQPPNHIESSVFPASSIIIGGWQKVAEKEGDIMVKWQYTNKNMVWEFLEGCVRKKIQFSWASIVSIKADLHPTGPQTLEVQLGRPPSFFVDGNYPCPRRHCMWLSSPDFTYDQATSHWRHCILFPPGELQKHYHKLQQYNMTNFIE